MKVSAIVLGASLFILSGCVQPETPEINDFWSGPHPEDEHVKFVIHFYSGIDTLQAHGYWLVNGHYNSDFEVSLPEFKAGEISFAIPSWECKYSGRLSGPDKISGCFSCEGEDPDSVNLLKNNSLGDYLVYPKPFCKDSDFQYTYYKPVKESGDSLFIHTMMNELLADKYGR